MGTPPPPLLSLPPPGPFPGWGGAPGCQLPLVGGGHPISFLPCCSTWMNVRVCYLHKALPSPQHLPPPSWGTRDPPPADPPTPALPTTSSTGARAWGRFLIGWGGGAAASRCRTYSTGRGGREHKQHMQVHGAEPRGGPATPSPPPPCRGGCPRSRAPLGGPQSGVPQGLAPAPQQRGVPVAVTEVCCQRPARSPPAPHPRLSRGVAAGPSAGELLEGAYSRVTR